MLDSQARDVIFLLCKQQPGAQLISQHPTSLQFLLLINQI